MSLVCPYCYETFNNKSNLPMELSCNHVLCISCINYLKDYCYIQICPLDNEIIDYSSAKLCQETLKLLPSICPQHKLQFIGLCKDHFQLLCESCLESHQKCMSIVKRVEELEIFMYETIQKSKRKTEKIIEETKNCIENMGDGIGWVRSESNTNLCELKEKYSKNIRQIIDELDDFHLRDLLEKTKKTNIFIKNIFQKRNEETKNCDEHERPLVKIIEEFFHVKKYTDELMKHMDSLANIELKTAKSSNLAYCILFKTPIPKKEIQDDYFLTVENRSKSPILITGLAIGRPIDSQGYVFIEELTIMCENNSQNIQNLIIEYEPNQISKVVYLEKEILLNPKSQSTLNLFMFSCRSYFFVYRKRSGSLSLYNFEKQNYKGTFPVFFFTIHTDNHIKT